MAQKPVKDKEKTEQQIARAERQEFRLELETQATAVAAERKPGNLRRTITLLVLVAVIVVGGILTWLILLPAPAQTPRAGVAIGAAAPTFALQIYGGSGGAGSVDLHALRGHPVILNFWSESCGPCRAEMPYIEYIYKQYGANGQFIVLGIDQADPKGDIATFGNDFKITYPLLFDAGGTVNTTYAVNAIPTTYFIDRDGIVRSAFITQLTPDTMQQGLASVGIVIQ